MYIHAYGLWGEHYLTGPAENVQHFADETFEYISQTKIVEF